ncbi:MAG: hypothetical protein K8S24_10395 [Candidatus Aegiribacteria sp.]|nr:hypothetical protein [Candidatus Aegiribacteria sp.]
MSNTFNHTGKLVLAISVSVGILISHGFSVFAVAVCLYAAGTAFLRGQQSVTMITVFLGGLSILSFGGSLGPALLTAGAAFAVVFSVSTVSRYLFFLSAAAVLFSGAIEGIAPLTAAALVAATVKRERWRAMILTGGLLAVLIISGLPTAPEYRFSVSEEVLVENGVIWPEPAELNLGRPRLLLQAPLTDYTEMTFQVSAGGVRDSSPVGHVASADRIFPVYPGENTILIEEPEFPVSILISRSWKPFTHPVIHFVFGKASL